MYIINFLPKEIRIKSQISSGISFYLGKKIDKKSIAFNMIHIPITQTLLIIYLIPFILYSSFLICFIPITQKTNAAIVTSIFITSNILSISTSEIIYYFTLGGICNPAGSPTY